MTVERYTYYVTIALVAAALVWARPLRAASDYVTNVTIAQTDPTSVRVCWETPVNDPPKVTPKFFVIYSTSSFKQTDPVDLQVTGNKSCGTMTELIENIQNSTHIEYHDTSLAGYSDYFSSGGYIAHPVELQAAKSNLEFFAVTKKYVVSGETFRLYGKNIGREPENLGIYGIWLGKPVAPLHTLAGDYYLFFVRKWTDSYIEFYVPQYDAQKLKQDGQLYINRLLPPSNKVRTDIQVKMLENISKMGRPIRSGLTGAAYRTVVNAVNFHYGVARTTATKQRERREKDRIKSYAQSIGKTVDEAKLRLYVNARVYGGYSLAAVKRQVRYGSSCVHATIKSDQWMKTTTAKQCMAKPV